MSSAKDEVLLLFGGTWSERDVSIKSAAQVRTYLAAAGFRVRPVRWDDAGWVTLDSEDLEAAGESHQPWELLDKYSSDGVEVVFNCLHGGPGEDGTVSAWLDMFKLAYTGAGVVGGAVSACKITFRQRVKGMGFKVPQAAVIHEDYWSKNMDQVIQRLRSAFSAPWVVKDPYGGSSDGVKVVDKMSQLQDCLLYTSPSPRDGLLSRMPSSA